MGQMIAIPKYDMNQNGVTLYTGKEYKAIKFLNTIIIIIDGECIQRPKYSFLTKAEVREYKINKIFPNDDLQ